MAYIGKDRYLAVWAAEVLQDDALAETCVYLLKGAEDPYWEETQPDPEDSRGFIIRGWFGPFLLGPPSRFLRGRC
ncbi:MAG: hypothetical protein JRI59_05245 [Deltaproteobacteria bacterium]|nr:hypothetical protein [Deltaproteobacteria bacterium]